MQTDMGDGDEILGRFTVTILDHEFFCFDQRGISGRVRVLRVPTGSYQS